MSLYESNESNGTVSLTGLFDEKYDIEGISDLSIEHIAFAICRGGFPATINKSGTTALQMSVDYVEAIINQDISRVDGVEKNPNRVRLLLRSLARNIATMTSVQTILKDMESSYLKHYAPAGVKKPVSITIKIWWKYYNISLIMLIFAFSLVK